MYLFTYNKFVIVFLV